MLLALLIEHKSLRKVARILKVGQPVVGGLLRELEHAIGQTLFIRSRTGVTPTPAALLLAGRSNVALETLRIGFDEVAEGATPVLRIGLVHHAMILHGIDWLTEMRRDAPGLQLQVHVAQAPELLDGVVAGDLDCAVARFPTQNLVRAKYDQCRVWQMPPDAWCIVARIGHSVHKSRSIAHANTLVAHEWVLPPSDGQTYLMFRNACMRAGVIPPAPMVVVDGIQYCLSLAANSDLLTICPTSMLNFPLVVGRLKPLKTDFSIEAPPLAFICRAEAGRLQAIQLLLRRVLGASLKSEQR